MTNEEKLRALLAEARGWVSPVLRDDLVRRREDLVREIDAALAEPVAGWQQAHGEALAAWSKVADERDEARAEIARAKTEVTAWKESAEAAERFRKSAIAEAEAKVAALTSLLVDAREGLDTLAVPGSEHNLKWLQEVRDRIKAALAEPVVACTECAMWKDHAENIGLDAVRAASETYKVVVGERDLVEIALAKAERERDEARGEVQDAIDAILLRGGYNEAQRQGRSLLQLVSQLGHDLLNARGALNDYKHVHERMAAELKEARAEVERARDKGFTEGHAAGRQSAYDGEVTNADLQRAFQRGTEAMRDKAQFAVDAIGCGTCGKVLADTIKRLLVPEEEP